MSSMSDHDAVPFDPADIFFSRTDGRGVIRSGNDVFQRISQFGWDALIGAPHKVIRHPDMPKGVFRLFWDTIGAGRPIGAYVKNRTQDGRHYWVFAVAAPIEGGYLSVRLKPTTALLATVAGEYRALRLRETEEGLTPEASAETLLERLAALGFEDYRSFMSVALAREIVSRDALIAHEPDPIVVGFQAMLEAIGRARDEGTLILGEFARTRSLPVNLSLRAARLDRRGATIKVIAGNHSILSAEIDQKLRELLTALDEVRASITDGLFVAGAARLQRDVAERFRHETDLPPQIDRAQEQTYLTRLCDAQNARVRGEVTVLAERAKRFVAACGAMRRIATGLDVTRVMCRIESARVDDPNGALAEIVSQLDAFHTALSRSLGRINEVNATILSETAGALAEV